MSHTFEQVSTAPAAMTQAARFRTRVGCLHHLASVAHRASVSVATGALLLALWLYELVPQVLLGGWLLAMLSLAALRLLFVRSFARHFDENRASQVALWEQGYAVLTGITGLVWGLSVWLPMNDPEHNNLFALTVILCVLLVSSSTLVASRKTFAGFAIMLSLPLIARLITLDDRQMFLIGLGVVAMSAIVISAFRMHHDTLIAALNSRHQSEHLLQQQRVIFESVGEGIVFLQPKPRYVAECNRRFAELLGYPLEAMPGMAPWRWHPDRMQWKKLVAESLPIIARGLPYHAEMQLQRADASLFWGEVTGMAVDANNLSAGTVWIVSDISENALHGQLCASVKSASATWCACRPTFTGSRTKISASRILTGRTASCTTCRPSSQLAARAGKSSVCIVFRSGAGMSTSQRLNGTNPSVISFTSWQLRKASRTGTASTATRCLTPTENSSATTAPPATSPRASNQKPASATWPTTTR